MEETTKSPFEETNTGGRKPEFGGESRQTTSIKDKLKIVTQAYFPFGFGPENCFSFWIPAFSFEGILTASYQTFP